jgi:hypothetical protein
MVKFEILSCHSTRRTEENHVPQHRWCPDRDQNQEFPRYKLQTLLLGTTLCDTEAEVRLIG